MVVSVAIVSVIISTTAFSIVLQERIFVCSIEGRSWSCKSETGKETGIGYILQYTSSEVGNGGVEWSALIPSSEDFKNSLFQDVLGSEHDLFGSQSSKSG